MFWSKGKERSGEIKVNRNGGGWLFAFYGNNSNKDGSGNPIIVCSFRHNRKLQISGTSEKYLSSISSAVLPPVLLARSGRSQEVCRRYSARYCYRRRSSARAGYGSSMSQYTK